jgi:hypothetical protein
MARIVDAIGRVREKRLSCIEAAELLGMSERHFRRLRDNFEEGAPRRSWTGVAVGQLRIRPLMRQRILSQTSTRRSIFNFTPKHFH